MNEEFYSVANDACIAATAEQAAKKMGCDISNVHLARATKKQKIGFCWVRIQDKNVAEFTPTFENNIFEGDNSLAKVRFSPYSKDGYFIKDDVFYCYNSKEKIIYKVKVIHSQKVLIERAHLAGIIPDERERPCIVAITKMADKKPIVIYTWLLRNEATKGRALFPVFTEDNSTLEDGKGNPISISSLKCTYLDQGQCVRKKRKLYRIMWDSQQGGFHLIP